MSIQATSNMNPVHFLFDLTPEDITMLIFSKYTREESDFNSPPSLEEDKTLIAATRVCKSWLNNPVLKKCRTEAATRLRQRINRQNVHTEMYVKHHYLPDLVRIFENHSMPILKLPLLNLGSRTGNTDYIDFLRPEEMNQPVMRFQDCYGRSGIALKIHIHRSLALPNEFKKLSDIVSIIGEEIQKKNPSQALLYTRVLYTMAKKILQEKGGHTNVLALFKRYPNPTDNTWSYGWGNKNQTIEDLYRTRHETDHVPGNCPTCLFSNNRINEIPLSRILTGQDPDFSLFEKDTNKEIYTKTILITALTIVTLAFLANYCFMTEKAS